MIRYRCADASGPSYLAGKMHMKKYRIIIILSSLFLCLSSVIIAASLALFVPHVSWQKNLIVEILLLLSLFPIIIGFSC
jgi:hypothetical protein